MKKIIALFLALSMMLTLVPSVMALETAPVATFNLVEESTVDRIFGLGLIPHTSKAQYQEEATFTRGELAWLLDTLYNYQTMTNSTDFTWQFYGNGTLDVNELKSAPATLEPTFEDVPTSHWGYEIIESVVASGLMNGGADGQFRPDDIVTIEQLAKCIVCLLGYESKAQYLGGYPNGYMRVATELGLLNGVKSTGTVTNAVLVRLLDNCLNVRLMEFDGIVVENDKDYIVNAGTDETFLTGILGLKLVEGVMEDNSVTSLLGKSKVEENEFVIDNVLLKAYTDIAGSLYGLIGREVECYFVGDPASKKHDVIIYAAITGTDKATVLTPDDFINYSAGSINYYEGTKTKKIVLSDLFGLIYNGKALSAYDESVFDISDGTITVVENGGDGIDVVIIEDFKTWYVTAVDQNTLKIFNRMPEKGALENIDLDDYKYITITKADGTPGTIADILPDSVIDVAANDDAVTIRIANASEVCVIDSLIKENGKTVLGAGEREFEISEAYYNFEDRLDFKVADEVTVYLNSFGKIAWMVYGAETAYKTAFIMDAATDLVDMVNKAIFKMYDAADKAVVTFYANPDKVRISNSVGKESEYKNMDKLISDYGAYRGIVRYLLNADREIVYIEFPITDIRNQAEEKLTLIAETTDDDRFRYNNFGGKAISDANTVVFCVDPANIDNENGFDIRTVSATFSNEQEYVTKCYSTKLKSKMAEIIYYETESKSATINYNTGIKFGIVKSVSNVFDEEEMESVKAIKAYTTTISSSSTSTNSILKLTEDCKILNPLEGEYVGELEPGDCFFYGTDAYGYVNEIRVLFDQNGVNPDSPNGAPGRLVDSKGYYGIGDDAPTFSTSNVYTGDPKKLPNPLTLATSSGVHQAKTSKGFSSGPLAIQYGFLARYNYGALEITSQDITVEEFDETGKDGKYINRVWTTPTNVTVINLSGKNNVEVMTGTSTALKPYRTEEMYQEDCSRMIIFSNFAMMAKCFVINGYFEK